MISVLFARQDSIYKSIPGLDVWDIDRDARNWPGGNPVIAHPPCRSWGRMRQFSKPRPDEKELAVFAVCQVRNWGGVLEHPESSSLWDHCSLPKPRELPDVYGGITIVVDQFNFGHRAEKRTWLYIVGTYVLPKKPKRAGLPTHCIRPTKAYPRLPSVTKPEREHTPIDFAKWLVKLAERCGDF